MESLKHQENPDLESKVNLAEGFNALTIESIDDSPFVELEKTLLEAGYELADNNSISNVLHNNSLLCRSENFTKAIDLVSKNIPVELKSDGDHANMCSMSSSKGYRIAMVEGFSGHDVGNKVKVVISFQSSNLSHKSIPKNSNLWEYKPETAEVSLSGSGQILPEDVEMISFRFPVNYFPENLLSESEKENLEENKIQFIVRHYIKEKSVH